MFNRFKRDEKRNIMDVSCKSNSNRWKSSNAEESFFALDVIKKLSEIEDNIVFWWIGNGPLEKEIKEYANRIGVGEHFVFLGKRSDVVELYQAMDVFFFRVYLKGSFNWS